MTHAPDCDGDGAPWCSAACESVRDLLQAVAPLLDRDTVSPYRSAWDIDPHHGADGEAMHERLRVAYDRAVAALGSPLTSGVHADLWPLVVFGNNGRTAFLACGRDRCTHSFLDSAGDWGGSDEPLATVAELLAKVTDHAAECRGTPGAPT